MLGICVPTTGAYYMIIDFETIQPNDRYFAMVQAIVPRPIAWVLTENGLALAGDSDRYNLAPYSFFTGICSEPPLLMISVGKKPSGAEAGSLKDTSTNIRLRKNFVVHIASATSLQPLNDSAETLNHDISEVKKLGLNTVPFEGFSLPRLQACHIAIGCSLYRVDEIGRVPQSIIYGKIETMYVADAIVEPHENRLLINPQKLDPLARLGGGLFSGLGELLEAKRPK